MKAEIKIRMIQINVSEFGSTQAVAITYRSSKKALNDQPTIYASFDHAARQVEKITEMLTDEGCEQVNVYDLRPQECVIT